MSNLLERSSLVLTPTAYNNGEALCIKPDDASGDFQFSRNSAATRVNAQGLVENVQILSSNLVQNGDFSEEGVEEVSNGSFSQEGVQLVTNGDFATDSDWGLQTGWSISGGSLNAVNTNGIAFQSSLGLVIGKTYKVSLNTSNYVSGSARLKLGGSAYQNISTTDSFQEFYFIPTSNTDNIIFSYLSTFTGSIDNVSVREVGQDWDLAANWSIAEDKAVSNGASGNLYQSGIIVTGKQYKIQVTVSDYVSGNVQVSAGAVPRGTMSANGTYTFYQTASSTSNFFVISNIFNGSITNISVKEVGMDWVLGTGWEIGNNLINFSNSTGTELSQALSTTIGKYKIKFDLNITSGTCQTSFASPGTSIIESFTTSGTKEVIIETTSNYSKFRFVGVGGSDLSITNISVIEITDDTNLPRINYEGFSYQDALGSEEIVNGGFDNGSANWSAIRGSIQSVNDEGVFTIGGTELNSLVQSNVFTVGKKYILEFYAKSQTYNTNIFTAYLGVDSVIQEQAVSSEFQKWKYIVNPNQTNLQIGLYNASYENIIFDNVSVKEYLGKSVVPNSGCGSWLFEPQSTNLVTQSETYGSGTFFSGTSGSTIDNTTSISPSGEANATQITSTGAGKIQSIAITTLSQNTDYAFSFYAKNVDATEVKSRVLAIGGSGGSGLNTVSYINEISTENWSRITHNFNTGTHTTFYLYMSNELNSGGTIQLWGAQLEALDYATSYIPTSGSQVTRNQDLCTNGGSLATINSTEGTLYAEIASLSNIVPSNYISLSDGTYSNRISILYTLGTNVIRAFLRLGGAVQADMTFTVSDITEFHKVAFKFKENDFALWIDGVEVATDTSGSTLPNGTLTKLAFSEISTTGGLFRGKTKAVAVWKEALSDSELQSLTTI